MRKKMFLKRDCHRMMRAMFPSNRKAYIWLYHHVGYHAHFSRIHDKKELERIWYILKRRYDRKMFNKYKK